jgi:hypothetical protein
MDQQVFHRFYALVKIPMFDVSFHNDGNGTPLVGRRSLPE